MSRYFYDSYALVSYLNGSKNYERYFRNCTGVTTLYNVLEVYYSLLRDGASESELKSVLHFLQALTVYPSFDDIPPVAIFKFKSKNRHFSYADCLGYALAQKYHLTFLTGDEGFRDISGVEFVKE